MSAHAEVRRVLERYQLRTKKRWGQNFLVDGAALADIAATAGRAPSDAFIEIGPGPGTLTRRLAAFGRPVLAIEKDETLVAMLREELAALDNVEIVHGDALDGPLDHRLPSVTRPAVVGNIPYNISSPLIAQLVDRRDALGPVTLLLQKEVVDRLVAEPGSKTYGRLSVLLQLHAEATRGRVVPPGAFWPPPKVHSAVIHWTWRSDPAVRVGDPKQFEAVVRAGFGQRRKMLRNALRAEFSAHAIEACAEAGFDLQQRAERLSLAELARLADLLAAADGE